MQIKKRIIAPLIFLLVLQSNFALELTEKEVEATTKGEYNRSSSYNSDIALIGSIGLNNQYRLRGGIAFGGDSESIDFNSFICANYSQFLNIPLSFSLSYMYNGMPTYETHSHTILPFVSYNAYRAGASIGLSFRFTSFFGEKAIFEPILSLYSYFNFINSDTLLLGIGYGNFNDFYAKNMAAFSLRLFSTVYLNNNWSIINEIELMQSGIDGLTSTFYGIVWRGGAKFSW